MKKILASIAITLGMVGAASAATVPCSAQISGLVSGASGCEISPSSNQDMVNNPLTVNTEAFFGNADWVFEGKIGDLGFGTGSGSGLSGSYDFSGEGVVGQVLLIFKGGNNPLVGYLLNSGVTSGTWSTPFVEPTFDLPGNSQAQNLSHLSVYSRTPSPSPVPLPAAGFLLIAGLGGLAALRRRA